MFGRFFSGYWSRRKQEVPAAFTSTANERTCSEHNLEKNSKETEDKKIVTNCHVRKRKLASNQKRGFRNTSVKSMPNIEFDSSVSSEEETEYDVKRKRAVEEREKMLRKIGVTTAKEKVKEIINQMEEVNKERRGTTKFYAFCSRKPLPLRTSMRLRGKAPEIVDLKIEPTKPFPETAPRKSADPIEMKLSCNDSETVFSDSLLGVRSQLSKKLYGPDVENDDIVSFKSSVQNLKLSPRCIRKVVKGRVTALAVHPSEHKFLVAAGDTQGNMGFWEVNSNKGSNMFQLHSQRINHTSFSVYSPEKLISTSMDGTVRCGDLNKEVSTQIYASDENNFGYHTYWHAEMSREVLLIAHGSGEVGLFDQREGKLSYRYKCHDGLIRTVQCHPTVGNYFVTGSGRGEARIWDIRDGHKLKPEPIINLKHPKIVTGSFFSPAGNYLLTTCTKGRHTIYDTRNFRSQIPKVVLKHHGKRLSKAKWYPLREDVFIVGNLSHYRRAAVYDIHGQLVHQFVDPEIQGVLYVCEFHPTQLAFVGGSTFGRIYAFV